MMKVITTKKYAKKTRKDYDPNPWAVCTDSVCGDVEDVAKCRESDKFERCVRDVKKQDKSSKSNRHILANEERWMQEAVPEKNEGKFTEWCNRHGHNGVTQACINEAAEEGGNAARMANFAVNANPGKYSYPDVEPD